MPTALLSVYDKNGIVEFAENLHELGWKILSSGGTAKTLQDRGVPVTDLSTIVGEPIFGHRVVTLSREIFAGILARDTVEDQAELDRLGIDRIDLVCVDMYPLAQAIREAPEDEAKIIELTDIGGPTLLRAAAKGRRIVICKQWQRQPLVDWLRGDQPDSDEVRRILAWYAESEVAHYVDASSRYLAEITRSNPNVEMIGLAGDLIHSCYH